MRSLVSGESLASVTSYGSRAGRAGATSVAEAAAAVPSDGANVFDVWPLLGTAAGIEVSSPQTPVCPGDGPGPTATGLPFVLAVLPFVATAAAATTPAPSSSAGVRLSDAAAVVPAQRAVPTTGRVSCRSGMPNPMMTPTIASAMSSTKAPGRAGTGLSSVLARRTADPSAPDTPRTWPHRRSRRT